MSKVTFPKYLDFPEYAKEAVKMETLKKNLQKLTEKKAEMSRVNSEHSSAVRLRGENIDSLIESGSFEEVETSTFNADDFALLNGQIAMLEQAIQKHQTTLDKMKNQVNPKLLKDVRAKYEALVKKITQAYIDIAGLHAEENEIINALEAEDIRYWGVMPRIHTSNIGYLSNKYAWIHFFLKEAEQQGYLKAKDYL